MGWGIEQSRLKSTCEECYRPIPKGEWRFGKSGAKARWFHLRCGARGAPQMFPPFAKQAKEVLGVKAEPSLALTEVDRAMVEKATGDGLPVLADWLQSKGDPWGELITLRLAGEDDLALEHFDAHLDSLVGDMPGDDLDWRDGVVVGAFLSGAGKRLEDLMEAVFTHRTAARLETLRVSSNALASQFSKTISEKAPPTLVELELSGKAAGLENLKLRSLETLKVLLNVEAFAGLLQADLPNLRSLTISSTKPLPIPFVEAFVASPLFARLTTFEVNEERVLAGTLSDAALMVLVAAKTAHLKTTWVELAGRRITPEQKKLADKKFAKSNARFLKAQREEPEYDVF